MICFQGNKIEVRKEALPAELWQWLQKQVGMYDPGFPIIFLMRGSRTYFELYERAVSYGIQPHQFA